MGTLEQVKKGAPVGGIYQLNGWLLTAALLMPSSVLLSGGVNTEQVLILITAQANSVFVFWD